MARPEAVLHSFRGYSTDGDRPLGDLIADSAGNLYGTTDTGGAHKKGTIFKLDPNGEETILHSFRTSRGERPEGKLVLDAAGDLYGTTLAGGEAHLGTVFKLSRDGTLKVLHHFTGAPDDGSYPLAGLTPDGKGNFYGVTAVGGEHDQGTLFKLTADNKLDILYSFTYSSGWNPLGELIFKNGILYGTTNDGGGHGQGAVFSFDLASNTETVLHGFPSGADDGRHPQSSLAVDDSGNLYGTTLWGPGQQQNGIVFKLAPDGTETILHAFVADGHDGLVPFAGVVLDAKGNIYGTTGDGGAANSGTAFKIAPSGKETILYSFAALPDGSRPEAGLLMDGMGNLFGTTAGGGIYGRGTVFEITR
ncbi:MAG: choice-of-anchor tandem repeat GloVer-containing protein [Alphaproteobacteria bacterium]